MKLWWDTSSWELSLMSPWWNMGHKIDTSSSTWRPPGSFCEPCLKGPHQSSLEGCPYPSAATLPICRQRQQEGLGTLLCLCTPSPQALANTWGLLVKCSLTFEIRVASGVESEGYFDIKVKVKKDLFQKVPWVWLLSSGVDYNSIHRKPKLYQLRKR